MHIDNKKIIKILNIIGVLCLVYFAIPYIMHDISIKNSNSMLSTYTWDMCGFTLTIGLIPLLIANFLAYKYLDLKYKKLKIVFYIPSIICLLIVMHYLLIATNW